MITQYALCLWALIEADSPYCILKKTTFTLHLGISLSLLRIHAHFSFQFFLRWSFHIGILNEMVMNWTWTVSERRTIADLIVNALWALYEREMRDMERAQNCTLWTHGEQRLNAHWTVSEWWTLQFESKTFQGQKYYKGITYIIRYSKCLLTMVVVLNISYISLFSRLVLEFMINLS